MTRTITPYGAAVLDELLAQIDTLERLHIAGESPEAGQVWDLFRKRDAVRQASLVAPTSDRVAWPVARRTADQPIQRAATHLVSLVLAASPDQAAVDAAARAVVEHLRDALTGHGVNR